MRSFILTLASLGFALPALADDHQPSRTEQILELQHSARNLHRFGKHQPPSPEESTRQYQTYLDSRGQAPAETRPEEVVQD